MKNRFLRSMRCQEKNASPLINLSFIFNALIASTLVAGLSVSNRFGTKHVV
jgi:hypothetical protein